MNKKELDEKSKLADQKRLESLKKMKNSYNEQKQAIKNALAGVVRTIAIFSNVFKQNGKKYILFIHTGCGEKK